MVDMVSADWPFPRCKVVRVVTESGIEGTLNGLSRGIKEHDYLSA